jgi:hypothetical protein
MNRRSIFFVPLVLAVWSLRSEAVSAEPAGLSSLLDVEGSKRSIIERAAVPTRQVDVRVRVIKATEPIEPSSEDARAIVQRLEPAIEDLAAKLEKIEFKNFRLLTAVQETVGLKKKTTLPLSDGQSLVVRPLYVEDRRAGLWLKWLDRGGAQILDTRMHFPCGESLLTGTDHQTDAGLILAIDVNPGK